MEHDIKKYQDYAIKLRNEGYNCAQCTLMALCKTVGMKEKHAARMAAPYGIGLSGTGQICGALNILGIMEGLLVSGSGPQDKSKSMWSMKNLFEKFKERNGGRVLCSELKGKEECKKCPDLIKDAIEIFVESHPDLPGPHSSLFDEIKLALNS